MVTLIDSSVLIAAEKGQLDLPAFLLKSPDEPYLISAISVSEILHGVLRASPEKRLTRETYVEKLLHQFAVLSFDVIAARIHARLWADLASSGKPIGTHDLIIAASALSVGARVATRDERSFPIIPGLTLLML